MIPAGAIAASLLLTLAAIATPPPRNDYANPAFAKPLAAGLGHFYARDFKSAESDFEQALAVIPDSTFAISFLNATAAQQPGELDILANQEEDTSSAAPRDYVDHVRLGFSYLFQTTASRDRSQDAREELNEAVALEPDAPAAHVGLGVLHFNERSANRAKAEFLAALHADPANVLAREYLGQLYQTDLHDPQRGLQYMIDVPNLVPGYADIEFHIGSLMSDLGQSDTAIADLKKGLDLDTGHVGEAGQHGYTLLARIYLQRHDTKDAKDILNLAVAADVDTIYANALLDKIKNGDYDGSAK